MRCLVRVLPLSKPNWLGSRVVIDCVGAKRSVLKHDGASVFNVKYNVPGRDKAATVRLFEFRMAVDPSRCQMADDR
jgi:hypothetical protein